MKHLIIGSFFLTTSLLASEDWFNQAQEALQTCKSLVQREDYPRAREHCRAAKSLLRGQTSKDTRARELMKEASKLLDEIESTRPAPLQASVVFPLLGSPVPVFCLSPGGCIWSFSAEVTRKWFPQPGASAELIPSGELQATISWQSFNGPRSSSGFYEAPGLAVRYGIMKPLEVGAAWENYVTSDQSAYFGDSGTLIQTVFDAKLAVLRGHRFKPTTTIQAGVGAGHTPFVNVLAQNRLGQRAALRYSVGGAWDSGTLQKPAVVKVMFGYPPINPNPHNDFSLWTYSAAVDYRIVNRLQGFTEIYGGAGYSQYIPATRIFRAGLAHTGRSVMVAVVGSKTISNYPVDWTLGVGLTYRLLLRKTGTVP